MITIHKGMLLVMLGMNEKPENLHFQFISHIQEI